MCGIAGIISTRRELAEADVTAMTERMAHRGPDDSGAWLHNGGGLGVGLGHRRLSIIDLSPLGRQPMCNEDGSVWLTFNGEVYNFSELRPRLEALGHEFRSHTDSEVLIHAYEAWGLDFLKELRGMFALGIWDMNQRRLVLARDRMGQKPLFYRHTPGGIDFASTLWSLLAAPGANREIDHQALDLYLTYQYVPAPHSAFKGVKKLPPAHYLVWQGGRIQVRPYWELDFSAKLCLEEDQAVEKFREVFSEAVNLRLVSDVPLGAFLSGGVDSSAVVAVMSGLSPDPVKTFSIGFSEESFSEVEYARMVARRYGTDHFEKTVRSQAAEVLPILARHFGEPFADSSALPTYYVSQIARRKVTVALNGDAGDENFAGYDRYLAFKWMSRLAPLARPLAPGLVRLLSGLGESTKRVSKLKRLKRLAQAFCMPPGLEYLQFMLHFDHRQKARVFSGGFLDQVDPERGYLDFAALYASTTGPDPVDRILEADMRSYLPGDLLVKVDVCSMAHALEARSPLLDHKLVELVASLPSEMKLKGTRQKHLFKKSMEPFLPPEILNRAKMGFGVPVGAWFRGELRDWSHDLLLSRASLQRGLLNRPGLEALLAEHVSGRMDHGYRIWSLVMLELWFKEVVEAAA